MKLPRPVRIGWESVKANAVPMVVLWLLAAAVTLANVLSGHRSPNDKTPVLVPPKGVESRMSTAVYPIEPPWLSEAVVYIRENVAKALIASEVAA